MNTKQSPKDTERLLAEADELVERINAEVLAEMEEEHRVRFEQHALNLERIKSEVRGGSDNDTAAEDGSSADGIHEAILDIVKAMRGFMNYIS